MTDVAALSPLAGRLLAAMCRQLADLLDADPYSLPSDRKLAGRIRIARRDAAEGIIELRIDEWLCYTPTPSERRACHRAIDQLASAGYVVRLTAGTRRATYVKVNVPETEPTEDRR